MASPARPSFWPFIKELLFNNQPITEFIRNNKLLSFSILLNFIFFFVCLFALEQTIQKAKAVGSLKEKHSSYSVCREKEINDECNIKLNKADERYEKLYSIYTENMNQGPKPKRNNQPIKKKFILPRNADDGNNEKTNRKLDNIR